MKFATRKFVDLIRYTSSKWANFEPAQPIGVGDYGVIDKETGKLIKEGNIYKIRELRDRAMPLEIDLSDPELQPKTQENGDDKLVIASTGVSAIEVEATPEVLHSVAGAAFHFDIQFKDKGGALLIVIKPVISSLPVDDRLTKLFMALPDLLKGKSIVTEVVICPAYVLAFSRNKTKSFSVSLDVKAPIQPAVTAGGKAAFSYQSDLAQGLWRSGSNGTFVPLYELKMPPPSFWKSVGNLFSGHRASDDTIDHWDDVQPPWDWLDEDGEEETYEPGMEE